MKPTLSEQSPQPSEPHDGAFVLHACRPAWEGNSSFRELVAFSWTHAGARLLVAVNLADHASQCFVELGWADMVADVVVLVDTLSRIATMSGMPSAEK